MASNNYNEYYQTENLFGDPYPELIQFFRNLPSRGTLLDLGCGQGRDAIPLARLGYEVTGIDTSSVGIDQMNYMAQSKGLSLKGIVDDIYKFRSFKGYKYILLDSMFHFLKNDFEKEKDLIHRIFNLTDDHSVMVFCIQDMKRKIDLFNQIVGKLLFKERLEIETLYIFKDRVSNHQSKTKYKIIILMK